MAKSHPTRGARDLATLLAGRRSKTLIGAVDMAGIYPW